eukprot:9514374-Lingulodinium_polyedra.AAC.1
MQWPFCPAKKSTNNAPAWLGRQWGHSSTGSQLAPCLVHKHQPSTHVINNVQLINNRQTMTDDY